MQDQKMINTCSPGAPFEIDTLRGQAAFNGNASSNKCIATSNKCLTSSNKKLLI